MNTGNLKTANIYGSGLIGRVDISGGATGGYYERLYYVKDHLGSTRVTISTVETGNNIAFAADYYPFGEAIREYQVGTKGGKYKFTEKERDSESSYDYFGARYYNNKLGVWLSVDPLAEKYHGWNPFTYTRNNPIRLIDPNGMDDEVFIKGPDADEATEELQKTTSLTLSRDKETGKLTATGEAKTDADKLLLGAISDKESDVILTTTKDNFVKTEDGQNNYFAIGLYDGSKKEGGKMIGMQYVNMKHAKLAEKNNLGGASGSVLHEILESYIGVKNYSGAYTDSNKDNAHKGAMKVFPIPEIGQAFNFQNGAKCRIWSISDPEKEYQLY